MNGMPFRLRALVHSSDERSSTKAYLLFTRQVTTGLPGPVVRFTCCFLVSTKRARRERTRRRHVVSEINAHTTVGQRMRALRAKTRYERDLAEVIVPGQRRRVPVSLSVCLSVCLSAYTKPPRRARCARRYPSYLLPSSNTPPKLGVTEEAEPWKGRIGTLRHKRTRDG